MIKNWEADNVVDVAGSNSITVQVNAGTIVNGDALEAFNNPGGVLTIDNLNVTNTGFSIVSMRQTVTEFLLEKMTLFSRSLD